MPMFDSTTPEYRLVSLVTDIANHMLFNAPCEEETAQQPIKTKFSLVFYHILNWSLPLVFLQLYIVFFNQTISLQDNCRMSRGFCSYTPFNYSRVGYVITGDVNRVDNDERKWLIHRGPKFREPRSFSCIPVSYILWIV